ncbi:unnamed protein product, partial [Didymodactylos carnosus]
LYRSVSVDSNLELEHLRHPSLIAIIKIAALFNKKGAYKACSNINPLRRGCNAGLTCMKSPLCGTKRLGLSRKRCCVPTGAGAGGDEE